VKAVQPVPLLDVFLVGEFVWLGNNALDRDLAADVEQLRRISAAVLRIEPVGNVLVRSRLISALAPAAARVSASFPTSISGNTCRPTSAAWAFLA
jgi:hypothetical protein